MAFRKEAKRRIFEITSRIFELWPDPFRHIHSGLDGPCSLGSLIGFGTDFEEFVELLAEVQIYGPHAGSERTYQTLKQSLSDQYRDLRPFLIAFLRFDLEDEKVGLKWIGRGTDAYQALWAAPSLQSFLESDDVFFKDRVARARDALAYYNDHLQYLGEAA